MSRQYGCSNAGVADFYDNIETDRRIEHRMKHIQQLLAGEVAANARTPLPGTP